MSNSSSNKWIVKDDDGKIYGPFSTEQVLEQIDRNYFLGNELIASYPGGSWKSISQASEFADRLLDVLDAEIQNAANPKPSASFVKDQRDLGSIRQASGDDSQVVTPKKSVPEPLAFENTPTPVPTNHGLPKTNILAPIIELTDLKNLERVEKLKQSKKPLMLIAGVIFLLALVLISSDGSNKGQDRIHLLAPRKGQPEIGEEKTKEKFKKALSSFLLDTFTGYQRSQNELVEAAEGASSRPENGQKKAAMLSTLCLVYRELWPYSHQDSKDLKTISEVMQEAKRLDPGGLHGGLCEVVHLMVNGRYRDAQGLADNLLIDESQTPVLFEIRGDIHSYSHDPASAATYFNQARTLWPAWQKTFIQEARARSDLKEYQKSIELYREVLKRVPRHGVAKIELGLIEALHFNQYDKGFELLQSGLDSSERVPRSIEAMGYFGMAQIYLRRNQKAKALEFARKAYALNSANLAAKEMVVSLAGASELKNTKVQGRELMYLGEQYVRAGDCFAAQAEFKAAFEAEPKNGTAAMKAGQCLWQLNQSQEAIEWLKKAIAADPQLTTAYVQLADYYAQRFDYYAAMEALKKVQQLQPQSYEVYRGFATVELRRNDYKRAIGFATRALKLYETDLETNLIMAKAHLGLQMYQDAKRFAAKAIELDYNSIEAHSLYAKIEAGLHGVEAGAAYAQNMINRYVITKGQQIPQAAIDYRATLAEIYMQDERYGPAEDVLRQAVSLDPNNKKALIGLGKVLQAQNNSPQALEYFLKAAVLDPSDADPIYFSGMLYMESGKLQEATRQFERVLKINSRYPKAHVQIGNVHLRLGNSKVALEEAAQEKAINPDLADAYILGAEAFFMLKQYTNCAAEYQRAVAKRGQTTALLIRMARCYRLSGGLDSALSLLRQAQSMESGNPELYKEQGAVFHTRGMADEAIAAYDTYLRLAPNAADRGEIESRIQKVQSGDLTVGE